MSQVIAGVHARTVVEEMIANNEKFKTIILDAKVGITEGNPNLTATGNVYVQEVQGTNPTNGLPAYSFSSGFSNTNATKKAALFRISNPKSSALEIEFDDYNNPSTPSFAVTLQPGEHGIFISTMATATHTARFRVAGSGSAWTAAGSNKPPNGNVFNWDGTTTLPSPLVTPSQSVAGAPIAVKMEKSKIKEISKVSSDPVFSDDTNWKLAVCVYKHKDSSKRLITAFRDLTVQKNAELKSSMTSGEEYQLHKIILVKADYTRLVVRRADIPDASSFDFILK